MSKRICKICGVSEEEHHVPDWLEIPDACVCNWMEWAYYDKATIPPICDKFKGDANNICTVCEHDLACHERKETANNNEQESRH